jgi:mannose-1-phosphate guanylyltransferase
VQAVVLVGGFGTRLRPLTSTIPKQLLPVGGIPIIERVLASLAPHGVDRAVLSMGYLPDPFVAAYPDRRVAGVEVDFAVEAFPLDTAGAIAFAATSSGIDETFLVVNGDILTDLDVTALVDRHRALGGEGTVHLTPVDDPSRFGVVVIDTEGLVTDWVEKPQGAAPSNLINAGTYVLEPSFTARVDVDVPVSIERVVFPKMIAEGRLFGMVDTSYWLDAGTPAAYLRANTDVLDGTRRCRVEGSLRDGSLLLDGAVVEQGATVSRSVLGRASRVSRDATTEGSVVLDHAVIGVGAHIVDSVVGPGATVHDGAVLTGNCIVAAGATVPEGSRLAGAGVER